MPIFAEIVADGLKRQTIRKTPVRMPKVGDLFVGFQWEGAAYRSQQKILIESPIIEILPIKIGYTGIIIPKKNVCVNRFAELDGFESWDDMRDWFDRTHGLPFEGILIRW